MKIAVVGATGTIGKAVVEALAGRHEVVRAARGQGADVQVDIEDPRSFEALWKAGPFDAVVSCAGAAGWGPLAQLGDADFEKGLRSKLMGQVNLARAAATKLRAGGSITLTSGYLGQVPMMESSVVSLVNAGVDGFVRAAALNLAGRLRVNVVSPPWVSETLKAMGMDPAGGLPAARVAKAYVAAVEGDQTGATIRPA